LKNQELIKARTGTAVTIEVVASRSEPKADAFAGIPFTTDVV